jgi:Domain of unknown function (DUF4892)
MQLLKLVRCRPLGFFFAIYCLSFGLQASEVFSYPAAELIDEALLGKTELNILLSSPKRISNALVIESQRLVQGNVTTKIYKLKPGGDLKEAYSAYEKALASSGQIEYQCEKRACGSSNYWANKIFNEHRLYGRDSNQYYVAGNYSQQGMLVWQAAYFVKNGLKQSLVYILSVEGELPKKDALASATSSWQDGVLLQDGSMSAQLVERLSAYTARNNSQTIYLISYSNNQAQPNAAFWRMLEDKSVAQSRYIQSVLPAWSGSIQRKLIGPLHSEKMTEATEVWHRMYVY